MMKYPKRLIEVDLPIKRISAHARREKTVRHGHFSSLHIWWARRPLAACRAIVCASLWPDPVDITQGDVDKAGKDGRSLDLNTCPADFREFARAEMLRWTTHERQRLLSAESRVRFERARKNPAIFDVPLELRGALLDFIADYANWENSTIPEYLNTGRSLTLSAHEALGGMHGTRPMVVDPFAGGGAIPVEALRLGADVFASDLNPLPVLLNKTVLQYVPTYGVRLADEVRRWGDWIKAQLDEELGQFYPKDADGATPIAYIWARTIRCEGPGCGVEVPLLRSAWLAKGDNCSVALQLVPNRDAGRVDVALIEQRNGTWTRQGNAKLRVEKPSFEGTIRRGSATCPCCAYTTSAERVRAQFKGRNGGADSAALLAVVLKSVGLVGRQYRRANGADREAFDSARVCLQKLKQSHSGDPSLVPEEELPYLRSIFNIQLLDVSQWGQLFSSRQMLVMVTLARLIREVGEKLSCSDDRDLAVAVQTLLAFMLGKQADLGNSLCRWEPVAQCPRQLFGRQAIGIIWDFAEGVVTGDSSGAWSVQVDRLESLLRGLSSDRQLTGTVAQSSATQHPLADDSAQAVITDPPYYDAVPYADLSDFFYVWFKRALSGLHGDLFSEELSPKVEEAVQLAERNPKYAYKTKEHFESQMLKALSEARRITQPAGLGVIVFAHKTTTAWETMLKAVMDAGWVVQASWPIDTEMSSRLRAQNSAVLASSVHLVCRPREDEQGTVCADEVGDWRDVLQELPARIHHWLPRLLEEGIVGADAIFACLGPALEIYSRYSRVEKASGERVSLNDFLEHVWATVSQEALSAIFSGASTEGFEADARVTAMWLWTLGLADGTNDEGSAQEADQVDEEDTSVGKGQKSGFALEYDAARKIAQGLGARLEDLESLVEISGEAARLLSVAERTQHLFGREQAGAPPMKKKKKPQLDLFSELVQSEDVEIAWGEKAVTRAGETALDRIHQSMILFAAGRSEALRRFLVDDGVGKDQRFWRLANALAALYPRSTDERRWVEGVLARKKGLGL
jgi:putative DNA methylase